MWNCFDHEPFYATCALGQSMPVAEQQATAPALDSVPPGLYPPQWNLMSLFIVFCVLLVRL